MQICIVLIFCVSVHGISEIWLELFSRKGKCGNLFFGKMREYLFNIYKAL